MMLSDEHRQLLAERIARIPDLVPFAEEIIASARTGIRLRVTDEPAGPDETRFGGAAALPEGVPWPLYEGKQQHLLAQIVLREIAPLDVERLLPPDGRLLFFHIWGDDLVLHVPDGVPVVPHEAPGYPARRVIPSAQISLPDPGAFGPNEPDLYDEYQTLFDTFFPPEEEVSMLLGYSMPIHGTTVDERFAERRLLLQVDSEERAGMMWGDCGRLYYMIRPDDLRARNFGTVQLSTQCY